MIGIVVAALAVTFLGKAAEPGDAQTILQAGVGIALVIGALCLFTRVLGLAEK